MTRATSHQWQCRLQFLQSMIKHHAGLLHDSFLHLRYIWLKKIGRRRRVNHRRPDRPVVYKAPRAPRKRLALCTRLSLWACLVSTAVGFKTDNYDMYTLSILNTSRSDRGTSHATHVTTHHGAWAPGRLGGRGGCGVWAVAAPRIFPQRFEHEHTCLVPLT